MGVVKGPNGSPLRTSISFIIPNRECGCNRLFFSNHWLKSSGSWANFFTGNHHVDLKHTVGVSCFYVPSGPFNTHGTIRTKFPPACRKRRSDLARWSSADHRLTASKIDLGTQILALGMRYDEIILSACERKRLFLIRRYPSNHRKYIQLNHPERSN